MPECARDEGCQAGPETRLLAFRSDSQVHVIAQPVVCILVPACEITAYVLRGLLPPWINVLQSIPEHLAGLRIEAVVSHARENTGSLGKCPYTIVLQSSRETEHVHNPHAAEEGILQEVLAEDGFGKINRR